MLRSPLWIMIYFLNYGDVSVLAEPTLNILKLNNDFYCALVNDTQDSAILWGYQNEENQSNSNTVFCNILNESQCRLDPSNIWSNQEDVDFLPILDHRWEGITTSKIIYSPPTLVYKPHGKNFRISFSFRAMEVHILLCDREHSRSFGYGYSFGKCYWIGINVDKGNRSYLRRCEETEIPTEDGKYAEPPCSTSGISNNGTKNLLNRNEWKHFSASKKDNSITLWSSEHNQNILEFKDNSYYLFNVTHVYVRIEGTAESYMKFHKVSTLHSPKPAVANILLRPTTASCLSLYVKSCTSCSFKISTSKSNNVIKEEVVNNFSEDWQRIVLRNNKTDQVARISLKAEVTGYTESNNLFWYMSSHIQKCDRNDIPMKRGDKGCCFALKYPSLTVCAKDFNTYKFEDADFECPPNAIGRYCLPCKAFGMSDCHETKMCYTTPNNGTLCSCAAGYKTEAECKETCWRETYGHNCRKQCGKCVGGCNYITGSCACETNFIGSNCDQPRLPIVKKAPTELQADYRRITIKLNLEYDGQEKPVYYQVQYKEKQGDVWINSKSQMDVNSQTNHEIESLKQNTNYVVRVLLYTSENKVYNGKYVPKLDVKTICADISPSDLSQNITGTSITMSITNAKEEFCQPINQFTLCLGVTCYTLDKPVSINHLKHYVNYIVKLQKKKKTISTWTVQTAEGPPGSVETIRVRKITNTSAELTWNKPKEANGIIRGYRVKYYRNGNRACPSGPVAQVEENNVNVSENSVEIGPLAPYSVYQVYVWSFTTKEGTAAPFKFETMQTRKPAEQEFPIASFTDSANSLSVQFQWNCSILEGPVDFDVKLICKSPWCSNEVATQPLQYLTTLPSSFTFTSIGYTNYTLTMFISRNSNQISKNISLRTSPTAPDGVRNITVYTKNMTSLSLRWSPPYPPKGEIEFYTIEYFDPTSKYAIVNRTSKCKIWQEQICHTFTVSSSASHVHIQIWAKNIDVAENGIKSTQFWTLPKEKGAVQALH